MVPFVRANVVPLQGVRLPIEHVRCGTDQPRLEDHLEVLSIVLSGARSVGSLGSNTHAAAKGWIHWTRFSSMATSSARRPRRHRGTACARSCQATRPSRGGRGRDEGWVLRSRARRSALRAQYGKRSPGCQSLPILWGRGGRRRQGPVVGEHRLPNLACMEGATVRSLKHIDHLSSDQIDHRALVVHV